MRPQLLVKAALVACLVGVVVMLAGPTGIAQGTPPGKGGGGGHTEAAVNNLSYPAVMIGNLSDSAYVPLSMATPVLGKTFSFGCLPGEIVEGTTYPNTSCFTVNLDGTPNFLGYSECAATICSEANGKDPATISLIYWQKVAGQEWSAATTAAPTTALPLPVTVQYLDWGDNLESRSWTTNSVIRVETTPFRDAGSYPLDPNGYQMWHVSGQGTNEMWGVRGSLDGLQTYMYKSPYSIIRSTKAKINLAYLGKSTGACPTDPGWPAPYAEPTWILTATGGTWQGASCNFKEEPYTAELNIGGKYVYGYNWSTRRDFSEFATKCIGAADMAGWWRLTFYSPDVKFDVELFMDSLKPPVLPLADPTDIAEPTDISPESETGLALYWPKVVTASNLTYIDICLNSGGGGGGGKK